MRIRIIILLLIGFCTSSHGQSKSIELNLNAGKIWKHKSSLLYPTPKISSAFQISYFRSLNQSVYWDEEWNQPEVGISFKYLSFGNKEVLGYASAILPGIKFNLISKNSFNLGLYNGFGIAWLNTTYNELTNPSNNAIGSHLNNISKLGLFVEKRWSSFSFKVGGDFIHYSNGGTQSPNSGINVVTGSVGFTKFFHKSKEEIKPIPLDSENNHSYKKQGVNFNWHYGLTEDDVPNGPKFKIQSFSLAWYKHFSKRYRLLLGAEYENNSAKYHFAINTFSSKEEARRLAKQYLFIVANEFFIVNYSFRFQTGFYTNYPTNFGNGPFYFKLISQYHFSLPDFSPVRKISIGVMMKSHWAKAENLALVIGFEI